MKKPRRRQEGMSHSISLHGRAMGDDRQGRSAGRVWAHRHGSHSAALTVNLQAGRTYPLVLNEEQQHIVVKAVGRLAQPFSNRPGSLSRLEDDVRYLLRKRVRAMAQQGRAKDAHARLQEVFDDEHADWIMKWALKPRQVE